MRVIVCGGGTGGHIYPAIAIAKGILDRHPDYEVCYVGTPKGMESNIVPKQELRFRAVEAAGWQGRKIKSLASALKTNHKGRLQAEELIKTYKPDMVIGTGGYVCLPITQAARTAGVDVFIHEQNAFPGISNRLISIWAKKIFITFKEAKDKFPQIVSNKTVLTGLPVRPEILTASKEEGIKAFNLTLEKPVVVVAGGSLGAKSINNALLNSYMDLLDFGIQLIWATGKNNYEEISQKVGDNINHPDFRLLPYIEHMELALAACDLYIGRAGATSIAELTARGIASVLIPYPFASENHQLWNARALADKDAAVVIEDKNFNEEILKAKIFGILNEDNRCKIMAENAKLLGHVDALDNILNYLGV